MGVIGLLYVREKSQKSIFRLNPFFRSTPAAQTQHGEMPKICLKSNFSLTNNWLIRLPSGHIVVPMGTTKPPEMDRIGQLYVREKMLRSQIFGLRGEHVYGTKRNLSLVMIGPLLHVLEPMSQKSEKTGKPRAGG